MDDRVSIDGRAALPGSRRAVTLCIGVTALRKVTRVGANDYEEDDLSGVMFVPLIGEQGWAEDTGR
jgi:hypothetical protein